MIEGITAGDIQLARAALRGIAVRTPLIPFARTTDRDVFFKPENIQPHGSFKIRCANYAVLGIPADRLALGFYTASAGNFGQGVAAAAAKLDVALRVYAPDNAARTKIEAMRQLGAEVIELSFADWWSIMSGRVPPGETRHMVHPCMGREVLIGNATIAAEILEDAPDIDAILVPFGGGGLALGTAAAVQVLAPHVAVIPVEVSSAAPLRNAMQAGHPVATPYARARFVDGIGGATVLPAMWPLIEAHISQAASVSDEQAAAMVMTLMRRHRLVVEGAGAVPMVAACEEPSLAGKRVAAIISGGNIDEAVLCDLMNGRPLAGTTAHLGGMPPDRA